jgi:hypothetical protein
MDEFWKPCLGCGSAAHGFGWPHMAEQHSRAWQQLDGYVGVRVRRPSR